MKYSKIAPTVFPNVFLAPDHILSVSQILPLAGCTISFIDSVGEAHKDAYGVAFAEEIA